MKIGLIDVDNINNLNNCFPNLVLMKISAYHKSLGDSVEWYEPLFSGHCDIVYCSKVFSFTPDIDFYIDADKVEKGGSGYCISLVDGKEVFDKSKDKTLPPEIEHIYPDYTLYNISDTAYGFLSRGCPRGCSFCHVASKEGKCAKKVADLSEFWNGQKYIQLMDPNILACKECKDLLQQLINSNAIVEFNQGLDIRLVTEEKIELLKKIKVRNVHFAWDRYQDSEIIKPKLKQVKEITNWNRSKVIVYVLCNFDTTMEQNLERIMFLRELDFNPYVMLYDKEHIPRGHILKKLQRWVNNKMLFWAIPTFEEYLANEKETH